MPVPCFCEKYMFEILSDWFSPGFEPHGPLFSLPEVATLVVCSFSFFGNILLL